MPDALKEIVKQPLLSTRQTEECADVGLDLAQLGGGDPVRCQDLLPLLHRRRVCSHPFVARGRIAKKTGRDA